MGEVHGLRVYCGLDCRLSAESREVLVEICGVLTAVPSLTDCLFV